jgi:hypothetical protein
MNERIKELSKQAYEDVIQNTPSFLVTKEMFEEKFAELIVTDAIGVLQKRFMGDLNREDMEVRRCIEDLKKHFGVEK